MTVSPLNLWLTSRTVYEAGVEHCPRERYLSFHAGDHGYGWQRKAASIPMVTGILIHAPLATILSYLQAHDQIPPDDWIHREAIQPAIAAYHKVVERRGLRLVVDAEELTLRVREQTFLLEGLVWTWVRVALPAFHVEHRVLFVEQEEVSVLGCTCGLGDNVGEPHDHDGRGCLGIGWQTRGDCVVMRRDYPNTKRYLDFKTTGVINKNWEEQWGKRVQLVAGVLGLERKLGVTIDEVFLGVLLKGRNDREWDPEQGAAVGPKYQNSPLVYGRRQPGNPPLTQEEWVASRYYFDEATQKRKQYPRSFIRTGLWELPEEYWYGACLSISDYWTRWIEPSGVLAEQYRLLGPYYRKDWALRSFTAQLVGEERRWQQILWALYELTSAGITWGHPEFMTKLDELVPMSRGSACINFYGDECPHVRMCDREPGWEDPSLMGMIMRRPHHTPELEQAIQRGLLPPEMGEAEYAEE